MHHASIITQHACLRDVRHLHIIAHNIANLQTPGFKRHLASIKHFDFKQGMIIKSDSPTHIALKGQGFFKVQTPSGMAYTRLGAFHINANGDVIDANDNLLLGKQGVIHFENTPSYNTVWFREVEPVMFDNLNQLQEKHNIFYTNAPSRPCNTTQTQIIGGALEQSNVNTVEEMIDLSQTMAHLQGLQRLRSLNNTLLTQAINQLGDTHA